MGSSSTPSTTQYLGNDNNDGTVWGRASTSKIGVWGATAVSRASLSTVAPPGTTAATTSTPWGFATSTQADALTAAVQRLEFNMRTLGFTVSA